MAAHKGHKKLGGRQKGTPNKITQDMRDVVREAFEKAGGVAYLIKQSQIKPVAFMSIVGKIIPSVIKNQHEGETKLVVEIRKIFQ